MITQHQITITLVKRTYGDKAEFNAEAFIDRLTNSLEWLYAEVTGVEVKEIAN